MTLHIFSKTPVKSGRLAGMRAAQLELKQTLLEHPDAHKVLEKVVSASRDEDHNGQAVAQTVVMDRLLLISTSKKSFITVKQYSSVSPTRLPMRLRARPLNNTHTMSRAALRCLGQPTNLFS